MAQKTKRFDPILWGIALLLLCLPVGWAWNLTARIMSPNHFDNASVAEAPILAAPAPPAVAAPPPPGAIKGDQVTIQKTKEGHRVEIILQPNMNEKLKEVKITRLTVDGVSALPSGAILLQNFAKRKKTDPVRITFNTTKLKAKKGQQVMCELSCEGRYESGLTTSLSTTFPIQLK